MQKGSKRVNYLNDLAQHQKSMFKNNAFTGNSKPPQLIVFEVVILHIVFSVKMRVLELNLFSK